MMSKDRLLAAMIAGIAEDPPWQDFVSRLRRAFDASHANVIFRRSDLLQAFMTESSGPEVEKFGDLRERHDPDQDPISYYEMTPFKAYDIVEFLTSAEAESHPFISQFLGPLGMDKLLICRVTADAGMQAWVSIARASIRFGIEEKTELERLTRLFAETLGIFGKLKTAEDQRDAYIRAMRARATGLIQLDQTGSILHVDEQSRTWVENGSVLCVRGERLRVTSPQDRGLFDGALKRVLREESEEEFLALDGEDQTLELLICRTVEPFESAWAHGPRAVVYLAMVGRESVPSLQRLMTLFKLTPREAALAQLLHRGLTINDAAVDLGISEQTVRAYLRQVFQKIGVTRQVDLVRRIQGSLAGLA